MNLNQINKLNMAINCSHLIKSFDLFLYYIITLNSET